MTARWMERQPLFETQSENRSTKWSKWGFSPSCSCRLASALACACYFLRRVSSAANGVTQHDTLWFRILDRRRTSQHDKTWQDVTRRDKRGGWGGRKGDTKISTASADSKKKPENGWRTPHVKPWKEERGAREEPKWGSGEWMTRMRQVKEVNGKWGEWIDDLSWVCWVCWVCWVGFEDLRIWGFELG